MDAPQTWDEVSTYVEERTPESGVLDFKREFSSAKELAKDVAGMTLDGGLLLYGIDEDRESENNSATAIAKVPVGKVDWIHQIVNSRIAPAPFIETTAITEKPGDDEGVIAVQVPPSPLVPHQANDRYPRRSGTITSYLSEPDVARLYDARRRVASPSEGPARNKLDRLLAPLQVSDGAGGSRFLEVGVLELEINMRNAPAHPREPWLEDSLKEANGKSAQWSSDHLPIGLLFPVAIARAYGSAVGRSSEGLVFSRPPRNALEKRADSSIGFFFHSTLGLRTTVPLRWNDDEGKKNSYACIHENILIPEAIGFLHFAGTWFNQFPLPGIIDVRLRVSGFQKAVSYTATHAMPLGDAAISKLRAADPTHQQSLLVTRNDLVDHSKDLGEQLLRRWCFTFLDDEESFLRHTGPLTAL